jgi:uncharacterized protein YceH (UPF0502 family)
MGDVQMKRTIEDGRKAISALQDRVAELEEQVAKVNRKLETELPTQVKKGK